MSYDKLYTDVKRHISTFLNYKDWVSFKNVCKSNLYDLSNMCLSFKPMNEKPVGLNTFSNYPYTFTNVKINTNELYLLNSEMKIKKIIIEGNDDFDFSLINFPVSLKEINFPIYSKFNKPINLPENLTHLSFGDYFNQPVNLPLNLTHLTFGYKFNQPVNMNIP